MSQATDHLGLLLGGDNPAAAAAIHRVLTMTNEGVWALDGDRRTVYVNAQMAAMLGCSPDEMLRRPVETFLIPGELPDHAARMQARTAGTSEIYERCFRHSDGTERWGRVSATPLTAPDGRFAGALAFVTDITDVRRDREELGRKTRDNEFLMATALRISTLTTTGDVFDLVAESAATLFPGAVVLVGRVEPDGPHAVAERFVGLEEARLGRALALIGLDPRGRSFPLAGSARDAFQQTRLHRHPGGVEELSAGVLPAFAARALERLLSITGVYSLGLAAGGQSFGYLHVFELSGAPAFRVPLIEAFAHQCALALSRLHSRERIEASERRFRAFFDLGLVGMGVLSLDRRWIDVNDRLCEILGRTREELQARRCAVTHPDDLEVSTHHLERACAGEIDHYTLDKRYIRGDGRVVHATVAVRLVRDAAGSPDHLLTFVHDISDRKRAELERLELERQLQRAQKLESLGLMAGGIAHDFNNLLAAVLGNLDLALQDLPHESPGRRSIEDAMVASRQAVELTRQMLAFSGKGKSELKLIDLGRLIHEDVEFLRASAPKSASIEFPPRRPLPPVKADPGQMQQVLVNLVTNAAEAIGDRPGAIRIATGVAEYTAEDLRGSRCDERPEPGTFVFFEVADTGCGMDAETERRLFDPFFTTKFTGRGLGMAAVLGIVRGHRGAVFVQTAPRAGTTVRVAFPRVPAPGDAGRAGVEDHMSGSGVPPFSGKVLLADDEASVLRMTQKMLERLGFEVIPAVDGQDAVERFAAHAPEVRCVLLDLTMPRLDGRQALAGIRAIRGDVPVIVSSGYGEDTATHALDGIGATTFIQKPYQIQELRRAFEAIMKPAPAGDGPVR